MTRRRLLLVLVAALLGVAAGPVAAGPAVAASGYCPRGTGVTVVVDNGTLGGGTSVRCDPNGANTPGMTVVTRAGYALTYVQNQPGFVCRVAGAPASASCAGTAPSDAYWGLFWSDGRSGTWSYASVGIGSLKVPAGGFIGWRFQGSTRTDPGTTPVSPTSAAPKPKPSPRPTPKPTRTPTPSTKPAPPPSAPASTGGGAAAGAAAASEQPRQQRSATATGDASATATAKAQPTARQRAGEQADKRAEQEAGKKGGKKAGTKAGAKAADRTQSAEASPSGTSTPSASGTADPDTDLVAGEQADGSGGGPLLPLVAGGLALVLLATVGRLAWVRRRG